MLFMAFPVLFITLAPSVQAVYTIAFLSTQLRTQNISMGMYRIAVVVGSLRKDSFNRKLATALARRACRFRVPAGAH